MFSLNGMSVVFQYQYLIKISFDIGAFIVGDVPSDSVYIGMNGIHSQLLKISVSIISKLFLLLIFVETNEDLTPLT